MIFLYISSNLKKKKKKKRKANLNQNYLNVEIVSQRCRSLNSTILNNFWWSYIQTDPLPGVQDN